ncbi:MAG: hypothetical protein UX72_C0030G0006 [Parcubacteria group bacterium GW2011_GWA2_47_10]|nr:MAG: hypothetical protein UX72_C0030G0006 [Parcubacteria group bacterium GW2011_GWA2_47_10]
MNAISQRIHFLRTAVFDREVGAVTRSSKYVIKNVLKHIPKSLDEIVEYGPGDGILTKLLLRHLSPDGKLIVIESNSEFIKMLNRIDDARLSVVHGKAQDAVRIVRENGIRSADAIIASMPFSFLNKNERTQIVKDSYAMLAPGGMLLIFNQYQPLMASPIKKYFGKAHIALELRNIPPCFIMYARKK